MAYPSAQLGNAVGSARIEGAPRQGAFERKLHELNSVVSELESLQRDIDGIASRLLDPRPSPDVAINKVATPGEPATHEAKLNALFERLLTLRARFSETVNFLAQSV